MAIFGYMAMLEIYLIKDNGFTLKRAIDDTDRWRERERESQGIPC